MSVLVIDVDGTLVTDNTLPSKEIIESLRRLSNKHNLIFASGRPYSGLEKIFSVLGSKHNAIALNGAAIYRPSARYPLEEYRLEKEVLSDILKRIWMEESITISAYSNSEWFIKGINNNIEKEANLLQIIPKKISFKDFLNKKILKISLIFNDEEEMDRYFLLLKKENASVFKSAKKNLEITAGGVDKGSGFTKLINSPGIDIDKDIIILIGNGDNDIPICKEVDISYSVANSSKSFRKSAQHALAKSDGEALLGLVDAINENKNFGKKADLLKPELLDVINQNMEIVSIGVPVEKIHEYKNLHLSTCIIFKTTGEEFLLRLKEDGYEKCMDVYCCTYNLHIPTTYTVDRTIDQFTKNFKYKLGTVRKLGFKHIFSKDEICHFFTVKIINYKEVFESRYLRWVSKEMFEEMINKGKVTEYLKAYRLLDTPSNSRADDLNNFINY